MWYIDSIFWCHLVWLNLTNLTLNRICFDSLKITSAKINISYSILFNLTTSYSSYFGGKKGISRNKTSFFLLMHLHSLFLWLFTILRLCMCNLIRHGFTLWLECDSSFLNLPLLVKSKVIMVYFIEHIHTLHSISTLNVPCLPCTHTLLLGNHVQSSSFLRVHSGIRITHENPAKKSFDCEKNQGWDELFSNESNWKIKRFLKESLSQQKNQGLTWFFEELSHKTWHVTLQWLCVMDVWQHMWVELAKFTVNQISDQSQCLSSQSTLCSAPTHDKFYEIWNPTKGWIVTLNLMLIPKSLPCMLQSLAGPDILYKAWHMHNIW